MEEEPVQVQVKVHWESNEIIGSLLLSRPVFLFVLKVQCLSKIEFGTGEDIGYSFWVAGFFLFLEFQNECVRLKIRRNERDIINNKDKIKTTTHDKKDRQ